MGNWVKNKLLKSGSTSVVIPAGSSAQRPNSPIFGQFRFNLDSAILEFFNGTEFVPLASAGAVEYTIDSFTGDGSTSVFTMSRVQSEERQILVFIGSIYQDSTSAYLVNGGFDITFTSPPPADEPITVIHSEV